MAPRRKAGLADLLLVAMLALMGVLVWRAWPHLGAARAALGRLADADGREALAWALALVTLAYALRCAKWLLLLRAAGSRGRARDAVAVFAAGLAASLAPGKVGEAWKAAALARRRREPFGALLSAVGVERGLDLAAIGLLAAGATALAFASARLAAAALALLAAAGLLAAMQPRLWTWLAGLAARRMAHGQLRDGVEAMGRTATRLARPAIVAPALGLALAAWSLEGVAVLALLRGLGASVTAAQGIGAFAAGTMAGVLSVLPGGAGAAEAGMAGWLALAGVPDGVLAAGVLLARAATLGYGAIVGLLALPLWFALGRTAPASEPAP